MPLRLLAASFLTALSICAQGLPNKSAANFYSVEKERSLGASVARDFARRTTPVNSAVALDYVQRIGARVTAQIPQAPFPITFAIVKDDEGGPLHEPVVFPGGYIFVPARLFLAAQNEGEIAGMMAHAMEHAAARHATREVTRREIANIVVGSSATQPRIVQVTQQQAIPLSLAALHRNFESEADLLAVDSMYAAGYDPQALASYIGRLQPAGNNDPASDLPERDLRITAIGNEVRQLAPRSYTSADDFSLVQDEVRRSLQ
jgi:predicted Zn-dependent protease